MVLGVIEGLALVPFALLEEPGDELTLIVSEATDGLATPQQMLCLDVLAILFCDGDQMIQAIIGQCGMPPRMAMVGNGGEMVARNKT